MPGGQKRVFVTPVTDVDSADKEGVGTIRWEGNQCYKYVKFLNTTATVAAADGDIVAYTAEDGHEDHEVCADFTDADTKPIGAGMVLATITGTLATAYYCWIKIKGFDTANQTLAGSPGDGDTLMCSTTDKTLTKFLNDDSTETNDGHPCAIAHDASADTIILDFPF